MLSKSDGWRKHFFFSPTWPPGPAGPGSGRGLTWGQVTCGPFLTDWELDQRRVWGATVGAEPVQSADCSPASSLSPTGAVTHSSLTSDPTVVLSGSPELFPLLSCLQFLWSSRRVFLVWLFVFTSCWEIKLQNDEKKLQKRLLNSTNDFIFWICKRCIF